MEELMSDTAMVYDWFNEFVASCILLAIQRHLGGVEKLINGIPIEVQAALLADASVPFYVEGPLAPDTR
jgi:hypothetical protein